MFTKLKVALKKIYDEKGEECLFKHINEELDYQTFEDLGFHLAGEAKSNAFLPMIDWSATKAMVKSLKEEWKPIITNPTNESS